MIETDEGRSVNGRGPEGTCTTMWCALSRVASAVPEVKIGLDSLTRLWLELIILAEHRALPQ